MNTIGFLHSTTTTAKTDRNNILVPLTFTHAIAFGQTGCGKTTSFIYPNLKKRIEEGQGILLYDYKGQEHLSVKYFAQQSGRLDDVVEIGKPWGETINIIEGMTEADLDSFFENNLGDNKNNQFWTNGSKSIGQGVLKILRAVEDFALSMEKVEVGFSKRGSIGLLYDYPIGMNITNMVKVCSSMDSLTKFIDNLLSLSSHTQTLIREKIMEHLDGRADVEAVKPIFESILASQQRLKKVINECYESMKGFAEESNEHLTQQFMGSLVAPLVVLSQNKSFNTDSFNIVKGLSEGKIVIINTEALSDAMLASLNDVVLKDLTMRIRRRTKHPISIFIDEAQRVLTKSIDLPVDVLREAKVDLFLATQNSALLKDKIGEEKLNALMGNLTMKYYFQNFNETSISESDSLIELDKFEYLCSKDGFLEKQKTLPIHITNGVKMEVEYMYQQEQKVLTKYAYKIAKKQIVLEYIPKLFEKNQILAVSMQSMKEFIIPISNFKETSQLKMEVYELFKFVAKERETKYAQMTEHENEYNWDDPIEEMFSA